MASPQRVARLCEEIKRNASDILQKMKDPRLGFVTVTGVELTSDLRYTRIYVSVLGDDQEMERTMQALESGTGHIRSQLGQRIALRYTPEVSFHRDRSAEVGSHIEQLIAQLHKDEEARNDS